LDAHTGWRRTSHQLELCGNGLPLLLEPSAGAGPDAPFAVDIMNPCWIYRSADLSRGARITAAVIALPFNYELGADAAKIRVGDARSADGELEVHIDGCETPAITLPLTPAAMRDGVTVLPAEKLPVLAGRHDLCLRFARPRLDPMWALDWAEIGE
jgi:hexosaminidase